MHDFDMVERYEQEYAAQNKKRNPLRAGEGDAEGDGNGNMYYGLGEDGFQAPHQMWNCCVLQ